MRGTNLPLSCRYFTRYNSFLINVTELTTSHSITVALFLWWRSLTVFRTSSIERTTLATRRRCRAGTGWRANTLEPVAVPITDRVYWLRPVSRVDREIRIEEGARRRGANVRVLFSLRFSGSLSLSLSLSFSLHGCPCHPLGCKEKDGMRGVGRGREERRGALTQVSREPCRVIGMARSSRWSCLIWLQADRVGIDIFAWVFQAIGREIARLGIFYTRSGWPTPFTTLSVCPSVRSFVHSSIRPIRP